MIDWKRYREDAAPAGPRIHECCQPVDQMVIKVTVEPDPGAWEVKFKHCGETRRGRAPTVAAAKEASLDAAEDMLCEMIGAIRMARGGFPIPRDVVLSDLLTVEAGE